MTPRCEWHTDDAGSGRLMLSGNWTIAQTLPDVIAALPAALPASIPLDCNALEHWDSTLASQVLRLHQHCSAAGSSLQLNDAPEGLQRLLALATAVKAQTTLNEGVMSFGDTLRSLIKKPGDRCREFLQFFGDTLFALWQWVRGRSVIRDGDIAFWFEQAGVRAIPIVTLVSLLVGLILAFLGAVQLRQFGAQVYVANLVSIGMAREMGALMIAIIMSGRTGAAYAAQLGAMQANDEIDSLRTMGISPMELLVLPRMLAALMALPLLTIYADVVGMIGGSLIAITMDISPLQYLHQTRISIGMSAILIGLGKSVVFAFLIALAGCRYGLNAGRSSTAVGQATTEAVVSALVSVIVADSIINILLDRLGIGV
ncbi:MAG TPA: ABC transporter permease [Pseudomonadales bacterium]